MKLVVDADSLAGDRLSGVGQSVDFLLRAVIDQTDNPVTCLLPAHRRDALGKKNYPTDKIIIKPTPPGRLTNTLAYTGLPIALDRLYGHGVYWFPNYKSFRVSKKSRSIVTIHDLAYKHFPETVTPRNRQLLERVVPRALKHADAVVAVSQATKDDLLRFYPWAEGRKIHVIHHGVNRDVYYPRPDDQVEQAKTKYDIDGDYAFFVSSIEPRKNLVNQLRGFAASAAGSSGKLSLVLVGAGGWLNDDIEATINTLKDKGVKIIRPTSWVDNDDVAALISGAKMTLYASTYEGFGMPVLESQACQTPVITSAVSSLPEAAGADGAAFVEPTDIDAIAAAIDQINDNPRYSKQLIVAGDTNQQRFSWDDSARQLIELITSVI